MSEQEDVNDITARSSQMPRNSALLFRNKARTHADASHFRGLLKLASGESFWVGLWPRTVHGEPVFEIRLTPKDS
jgi:hypothetical protein